MNGMLIKIVIGFTYKLLWWKKNSFVQCSSVCDVDIITGFLTANCSSRPLIDVPQDLDPNVEFLFLSNNHFKRIDESSFARYQNLKLLSLEKTVFLDPVDPINYYTFRPLKKLEMILLNEIYTPFNFSFYWPPSIRLISVNHNTYISDMDFSLIKKLQDVHAVTHSLRSFPKFHKHSPIAFLDFRGNPMDTLTAEDLAPFCTLDFLSLEWPAYAIINGSERYCQCMRLENWILMNKIGVNGPLNCTPPTDADAEMCNVHYSEDTFRIHRECLGRVYRPSLSGWFWITLGVLVLAPLIVVTFKETKTQQRFSHKITTTAKQNPKFPAVKLKINMDEDFEEHEPETMDAEQESDDEDDIKSSPDVKKTPEKEAKMVLPTIKENPKDVSFKPTQKNYNESPTTNKISPNLRNASESPVKFSTEIPKKIETKPITERSNVTENKSTSKANIQETDNKSQRQNHHSTRKYDFMETSPANKPKKIDYDRKFSPLKERYPAKKEDASTIYESPVSSPYSSPMQSSIKYSPSNRFKESPAKTQYHSPKYYDSMESSPVNKYEKSPTKSTYRSLKKYDFGKYSPVSDSKKFHSKEIMKERLASREHLSPRKDNTIETICGSPAKSESFSPRQYGSTEDILEPSEGNNTV